MPRRSRVLDERAARARARKVSDVDPVRPASATHEATRAHAGGQVGVGEQPRRCHRGRGRATRTRSASSGSLVGQRARRAAPSAVQRAREVVRVAERRARRGAHAVVLVAREHERDVLDQSLARRRRGRGCGSSAGSSPRRSGPAPPTTRLSSGASGCGQSTSAAMPRVAVRATPGRSASAARCASISAYGLLARGTRRAARRR